jgi:hypothetical protein
MVSVNEFTCVKITELSITLTAAAAADPRNPDPLPVRASGLGTVRPEPRKYVYRNRHQRNTDTAVSGVFFKQGGNNAKTRCMDSALEWPWSHDGTPETRYQLCYGSLLCRLAESHLCKW